MYVGTRAIGPSDENALLRIRLIGPTLVAWMGQGRNWQVFKGRKSNAFGVIVTVAPRIWDSARKASWSQSFGAILLLAVPGALDESIMRLL